MQYTWGWICKERKENVEYEQKTSMIRKDFTSCSTSEVKYMYFWMKEMSYQNYMKTKKIRINQFVHTMINIDNFIGKKKLCN